MQTAYSVSRIHGMYSKHQNSRNKPLHEEMKEMFQNVNYKKKQVWELIAVLVLYRGYYSRNGIIGMAFRNNPGYILIQEQGQSNATLTNHSDAMLPILCHIAEVHFR